MAENAGDPTTATDRELTALLAEATGAEPEELERRAAAMEFKPVSEAHSEIVEE
jgi:hypothetical protein